MNTNTRNPNPPGDDLDRLFSAYFQAELPAKWPAAPRPWADPARPKTANTAADPSVRSRWALAASVAILLGGCWYLSGQLTDGKGKAGLNLEGGGADLNHIKKAEPKKAEPKMP
jgi:hypothetical protein